jgi:polyisoprenoid-binding protein YceI
MLLALLIAASLAPAYRVDPSASTIKYTVVHKLHQVDAASKQVEGKVLVRDDGAVLAELRAPVMSFRSGDGNRDEHMAEVLEVGKYPVVVFKAVARLGSDGRLPAGGLPIDGQVELHGVKHVYRIPLTVSPREDGSLHVTGAFDLSLDAHHIERPSLLFVKIDDACHLDVDLVLLRQQP